jgi:hypothetical protein
MEATFPGDPMGFFSIFPCKSCKHRDRSPEDRPEVVRQNSPEVKPQAKEEAKPKAAAGSSKKKPEERICPITGAVGYCPMARPPPGSKLPDVKPELKVMMMLLWEDEDMGSKVSVGVYPHMNEHWKALELPDTSSKAEIKAQFHKLSLKYHPDKNPGGDTTERFKQITEAFQALREVDGTLAFPWDKYPERQRVMTSGEGLRIIGPLAKEAVSTDPIKAQMMQHVVKESTDCRALMYEQESVDSDGVRTKEIWADGLCEDSRNGSNHLVKVYRRIVSLDGIDDAAAESDKDTTVSTAASTADGAD